MPNLQAETDRLENAVARIIEARDGDIRKALKSLIFANEHLEAELNEVCAKVSTGFMRGAVRKQNCSKADWSRT
jgi:hypothetical protein